MRREGEVGEGVVADSDGGCRARGRRSAPGWTGRGQQRGRGRTRKGMGRRVELLRPPWIIGHFYCSATLSQYQLSNNS